MVADVLPDSRPTRSRGEISGPLGTLVQVYCANCGHRGPQVLKENLTFACYLCDPCAEKWGTIAGAYLMPDEVYFQKCAEARLGQLAPMEILRALDDPRSEISLLAKDRQRDLARRGG